MTPYFEDQWLTILEGDCREVLRGLPAESVNCVVTSPPYFGLRDYGVVGQLGLEPTPELYVAHMVEVFREVRRVLRKDGTVFLNLGDTYNNADKWGGGGVNTGKHIKSPDGSVPSWAAVRRKWAALPGLKPKDRIMVPARVALALQADGWWLRDEIVWAKPNPMPSSVTDRTTPAHEMVYLLTKSARYWYDAAAIAEPALWPNGPNAPDSIASPYGQGFTRRAGKQDFTPIPGNGHHVLGFNDRWDESEDNGSAPGMRNRRSVWTVATQPYPEAHFATFPEALVEPMVKAGCSEGGTVLDPFAGSGTVGLVAQRLSRRAILVDLNAEYLRQCLTRNQAIPLGLLTEAG